jgi:hypothetical protein
MQYTLADAKTVVVVGKLKFCDSTDHNKYIKGRDRKRTDDD